ncbi:MAG: hypothetical protein ACI31B_04345 [Muribaculaceae bacterium]
MGFWTTILRGGGRAVASAGDAIIHPQRTLTGAGKAVKTAAVGGAVGYVGWEKLTTDKSVTRIVSDAVIGSDTTDAIADTVSDVKELKTKAGEAVDAVNGVATNMSGIGNFMHSISTGNVGDMFGNLFSNITSGKVGGMSLLGLVAAAFMTFGRFGWLSKIAGVLLGMYIIGNNSRAQQAAVTERQRTNEKRQENVAVNRQNQQMEQETPTVSRHR